MKTIESTNRKTIMKAIEKLKADYTSGKHLSDLDFTDISNVINYISEHTSGNNFYIAYSSIDRCLDILNEYIVQYSDCNGYYSPNPKLNKKDCDYKFKTERQLQRDLYVKGRDVNQYLFCNFLQTNEYGEEYYTFDYVTGIRKLFDMDADDCMWLDTVCKSLTQEEKNVFGCRLSGLTLEKCASALGMSMKQVRNRLESCKQKLAPYVYKHLKKEKNQRYCL